MLRLDKKLIEDLERNPMQQALVEPVEGLMCTLYADRRGTFRLTVFSRDGTLPTQVTTRDRASPENGV